MHWILYLLSLFRVFISGQDIFEQKTCTVGSCGVGQLMKRIDSLESMLRNQNADIENLKKAEESQKDEIENLTKTVKKLIKDVNLLNEEHLENAATTDVAPTPTSTATSLIEIQCEPTSAQIGESGVVTCQVNAITFDNITVTRSLPGTTQFIGYVTGDGTVQTSGIQNVQISFNNAKQLSITVTNVTCSDDGNYIVTMDQSQSTASFTVIRKPSLPPLLTLGIDNFEAEQTSDIVCTGDIGKPTGQLVFQMRNEGDSNYVEITGVTPKVTDTVENCTTQRQAVINLTPTMSMNNSLIRCVMTNSDTGQTGDTALTSNDETFLVVPQSVCSGIADNDYTYHPYDCNRYVRCIPLNRAIQKCATATMCFDIAISNCQHSAISNCVQCPDNTWNP